MITDEINLLQPAGQHVGVDSSNEVPLLIVTNAARAEGIMGNYDGAKVPERTSESNRTERKAQVISEQLQEIAKRINKIRTNTFGSYPEKEESLNLKPVEGGFIGRLHTHFDSSDAMISKILTDLSSIEELY